MYLPNFSQIFCHRMSGHTLLSASNSISIPRESYKGMSLEMPFGTSELRPNPLKPVSHLGTGALWTTDALSFGRLHCGLYPRSMRVIKFIPLIILNVSSGIALAMDCVGTHCHNVNFFALWMVESSSRTINHTSTISSADGGIGCGLDLVKLFCHLRTSASSSTISSYAITRGIFFHSLSMLASCGTSAVACNAKKSYGVVKPVQPKPDTTTNTPSRRIYAQSAAIHAKNTYGVVGSLPNLGPETTSPTPLCPVAPSAPATSPGNRRQNASQVLEPTKSSFDPSFVSNLSMIEEYISIGSASVFLNSA